ncbi:DUF58 domain-containing protein [Sphaerotilus sp.]|uniref:DUF58 domain-containing protein n=1 Tax=Sphaerotilus sp. TaxID=2093942 RepID=UPI0034E26EFC
MALSSGWRLRWRAWWARRHPRTDTLHLDHRNLYIVPTASGLVYGVLLGCLLLGSINYQLNLGHLLTFTLASTALVALHATHATLSGLHLSARVGEAGFVGQTVDLDIALQEETATTGWRHPARFGRHGLVLRWRDESTGIPVHASPDPDALQPLTRRLDHRGRQTLPPLELSSRFPLGLFRVWAVWRIAQQPLAWPAPEVDAPPVPQNASADPADAALHLRTLQPEPGEDEGVRPWRREDRPAQVLWRRSARSLAAGGGLLVRETPPARQARGLHLDGDRLTGLDPEARLRRLSAWVLQADALGQPYRLRLGALSIEEGAGPSHRRRCLDALALWSPP